ncbi:RagB/SusD family nutrient uptake outer membrane protein [Flavitalea flava]
MITNALSFSSGGLSIFAGLSADELIIFDQTKNDYVEFQQNSIATSNPFITNNLWGNPYSILYAANSIIDGLQNNSGVHDSVKNELTGEAEFIRAFCNFYLINLFGEIPMVTTTNWHKTSLLGQTKVPAVYQTIIADLLDAQHRLSVDFSVGSGQRIVPNKWAATALLARVYLYIQDWKDAELQATTIIENTTLFSLATDLNSVYLTNSSEAIWQLQQNNSGAVISYNTTPEGYQLIPPDSNFAPFACLSEKLLAEFEPGDKRKTYWVETVSYKGGKYSIPYKYKAGPGQATINGPYSEYYMVFRLAEQYLIRAEARANQNNLGAASSDLSVIRARAGLSEISFTYQTDLLSAVANERQIELFAEWGNRWLDLKRTGQATSVLSPIKPHWTENALLYPIPLAELRTDPNLVQNNGY